MSTTLVQIVIGTPAATLVYKCDEASQLASLLAWLSPQKIEYSKSIAEVSGPGTWCVASDVEATYYTLVQVIDTGEGWSFNDVAWLKYCPSV